MKAYHRYKEISIEYYRILPSHWGTVPLKYVCYMKGRIGWQGLKQEEFTDEGPYLITGMNFQNGKMDWEACYHITQARFEEAPEIHVREGDVLITKDGTIGKLLFIENLPGPTSLNSHLLLLRPLADEFEPKYLYYLLKSEAFISYVNYVKTGTTFYGITQEAMGDFRMLLFDKTEQRAIADFLDRKTEQIDTLIANKQRLVELLKEYRTALINAAVTKGLKPDAPMKDSGIAWLGDVPCHWKYGALKYLLVANDGGVWGEDSDGNGTVVFRSTEITLDGKWDLSNPATRSLSEKEVSKALLLEGDLIITKSSGSEAHIGKTALVTLEIELLRACYSNFMQRVRPGKNSNSRFIHYFLNSSLAREQYNYQSTTTTGLANLNSEIIDQLRLPFPPLPEQRAIADFLDRKTEQIDALIKKVEDQITHYKEYRTALISAAVTGKIDVRGEQ